MPKGAIIRGFDGREWYSIVRERIEKTLKNKQYEVIALVRIEHKN